MKKDCEIISPTMTGGRLFDLFAIAKFFKHCMYVPNLTATIAHIHTTQLAAMVVYSSLFMRFALRVKPRNILLFACHLTNFSAQSVQLVRVINYKYGFFSLFS